MLLNDKTKAFTLLEIIVVIIILGILATLGFTQYSKLVEKGRTAEAKTVLSLIRTAEQNYYLEHNFYTASISDLAVGVPSSVCESTHYYRYYINADLLPSNFTALAYRCDTTTAGKTPLIDPARVYWIYVDKDGNWGGDGLAGDRYW